jgi:hypothetical protein
LSNIEVHYTPRRRRESLYRFPQCENCLTLKVVLFRIWSRISKFPSHQASSILCDFI